MSDQDPVRIVLTPEQRELVRRLSGEHVEAIELASDDGQKSGGQIRFRWRLSTATGIPRQAWIDDAEGSAPTSKKEQGD